MEKRDVRIIIDGFGKLPYYATELSAGADLYAANAQDIILQPMERCIVPTGVYVELPTDAEMQIRPRSGLAVKKGITVINAPGTIDADYQGEVGVPLINLSNETFVVKRGERIAQAVCNGSGGLFQATWKPVEGFQRDSERGAGGYGHTGMK